MTEPTSHFFIARVGAAAPDLESRLVQWASSSCQAHCVVRDGDGRVALYLHRWGLYMGDLGKGWLELCTEEDYKAAASTACDETTTPCTSRVRVDPQIEERATAPLRPCVEAGVILHALPPGFDERSQEMYRQLLMLENRQLLSANLPRLHSPPTSASTREVQPMPGAPPADSKRI